MAGELATSVEALTAAEADRLSELEATVQRGLASFIEVGNALHRYNRIVDGPGGGCSPGTGCKGLGWMTQHQYENAPDELKAGPRGPQKGAA